MSVVPSPSSKKFFNGSRLYVDGGMVKYANKSFSTLKSALNFTHKTKSFKNLKEALKDTNKKLRDLV